MIGPILLFSGLPSGEPIVFALIGLVLVFSGVRLGILAVLYELVLECVRYPALANLIFGSAWMIIQSKGMLGAVVDILLIGGILGIESAVCYVIGRVLSKKVNFQRRFAF